MRAMTREHVVEGARVAPGFETSASKPPGAIRARSRVAQLCIDQWKACATVTAWAKSSGAGSPLRFPSRTSIRSGIKRTHFGQGLDRDNSRTTDRHELPRELPGAGSEIDDDAARPEAEPLGEDVIASGA